MCFFTVKNNVFLSTLYIDGGLYVVLHEIKFRIVSCVQAKLKVLYSKHFHQLFVINN